MNQLMIDDLEKWQRILQDGERGGLQLTAPECHFLLTLVECSHDALLDLGTQNEILRRAVDVLDPEGSRRGLEMQCADGDSAYEARTQGAYGRIDKARYRAGKSVFRNL